MSTSREPNCILSAWPDKFRENLHVSPHTFNKIVAALEKDPQQVAITLYQFGHDGNSASLQQVANWSGVAKGTVGIEKEAVKCWVKSHSCQAWHDGWCLVNGTLVPLFEWPYWFRESYFDWKSNYSLNVQIISLPNLQIIDFGYGYTGSTHDSTTWEATSIVQEHESVFEDDEFIWADSAYPVYKAWVGAPYKQPE
ncbi:hypothetical protein NEOLEDRAFT_1157052 [Neolentinus lepideus HHB14362 ss-1]|uniref:DDE Tnp4 domain-containing protein n=1 Tax=Neolentinus lepideus HHB14362 ss-1 TaxID=1314782 RepID=A0A165RK57_9AGAM|nr:hypothetical protein NEOLEDRAFT_1157052 [Neolentinus lepideus HHB14362 ss-1]